METKSILEYLIFKPTDEQKTALIGIEGFLDLENLLDFLILTGSAGTGKTSIISAMIGYLRANGREYHIAAPTGRAARIVGNKAKATSKTIHSLIYLAAEDPDTGRVNLTLKRVENKDPMLFIIDEASMIAKDAGPENDLFGVTRGLLFDLIAYIKSANVHNKVIFIGDRYQLPPVKEEESFALNKAFMENRFNLTGAEYHLTEVKRQKDGSYILDNANLIKEAMDNGLQKAPIKGDRSPDIYKAADKYVREQKAYGEEYLVTIVADAQPPSRAKTDRI